MCLVQERYFWPATEGQIILKGRNAKLVLKFDNRESGGDSICVQPCDWKDLAV